MTTLKQQNRAYDYHYKQADAMAEIAANVAKARAELLKSLTAAEINNPAEAPHLARMAEQLELVELEARNNQARHESGRDGAADYLAKQGQGGVYIARDALGFSLTRVIARDLKDAERKIELALTRNPSRLPYFENWERGGRVITLRAQIRERPEFPTYIGSDGKEHAEF